jgi:ribose/xylose/arabinose/galactoside ABC-type transport system permease subunit
VSGINVDRVRLFCYSSSGVMGGLSVWGPTPSSGYWPCDCF